MRKKSETKKLVSDDARKWRRQKKKRKIKDNDE